MNLPNFICKNVLDLHFVVRNFANFVHSVPVWMRSHFQRPPISNFVEVCEFFGWSIYLFYRFFQDNKTAIYCAVEKGNTAILKLLLDSKPDLEIVAKVRELRVHLF